MSSASLLPHFLQPLAASTSSLSELPVDASFQHSPTLGNASAHCLWWPNKAEEPSTVLLFVPGNPGLAGFYIPYLKHIHDSSSESIAILAHSMLGHSPKVSTAYCSLQSQVEGIIEVIDALRERFDSSVNLVLVGHSVGAWVALQATKERQQAITSVFLLFPTITHIVKTPNGNRLSWLFRSPIRILVSNLSRFLRLCPKGVVARLFKDWPPEQFDVLWSFLNSPASILNSLTMANEEMQTIKELDVTLLDAVKHKLYIYLAEQDDWVGENKRAILREMADEPHSVRVIHGEHGIPHAYCINHGNVLAEECLKWLQDKPFQ